MSTTGRHAGERHAPARPVALVAAAVVTGLVLVALGALQLVRGGVEAPLPRASAATLRFTPPAAVPTGSELVRTRVLDSGALRVDHWVRPAGPVTSVGLAVPGPLSDQVSAQQVRVETVAGVQSGADAVGARGARYAFPASSTLHVSYVLTGAVVRSDSAPGRALARLASLSLTLPRDRRATTVELTGGRLLAAACAPADAAAGARPCGRAVDRGWRVVLPPPARHHVVTAQLDLGP